MVISGQPGSCMGDGRDTRIASATVLMVYMISENWMITFVSYSIKKKPSEHLIKKPPLSKTGRLILNQCNDSTDINPSLLNALGPRAIPVFSQLSNIFHHTSGT
jgi:hypothetical protein